MNNELSPMITFVLSAVLTVFDVLVAASPADPGAGTQAPIQCYSCMSLSYQDDWAQLSGTYKKPKSFTDRCNHPFVPTGVETEECSNICLTLKEDLIKGGIRVKSAYIRGCYDNIMMRGFNETAIKTHNFKGHDTCRFLPRQHLTNAPLAPSNVEICSCYQDYCNSGPAAKLIGGGGAQKFLLIHPVLLISTALSLLWTFQTSTSVV